MSLDPAIRSRICGSKVRTGCLTCKTRHLKCDETKPICIRCKNAGRPCQQPNVNNSNMRMVHYVSKPPSTPSSIPTLDETERWYLHRFQTRTGPELAGVHDPEIWQRHVVHIALQEPAIKHALFAVTGLQQRFERSKNMSLSVQDIREPLSHYTKAISSLTRSMNTKRWMFPDTPLVACMLFCAFESMSYHLDSAISHIFSGLKILVERIKDINQEHPKSIPPTLLYSTYTTMDTQGLELGETSFRPLQRQYFHRKQFFQDFTSVGQAQHSFNGLVNAIFRTMHELDELSNNGTDSGNISDVLTTFQNLISSYRAWCDYFDRFLEMQATDESIAACVLLQLWRILVNINLQVDLRKGEMDFDNHTSDFQALVELAVEFVILQGSPLDRSHSPVSMPPQFDPKEGENVLHQCKHDSSVLRGGYLGIDASITPLMPSLPQLSVEKLSHTTSTLLERSRLKRGAGQSAPTNIDAVINAMPRMKPSYSFSHGIVSPLYVTISRCRDPTIRRQALSLMQKCKRREGLWDSALAATLGQRVVAIEEQRALNLRRNVFETSHALHDDQTNISAGQVPNEARVRVIKPTFLPDRKSIERYYFGWPGSFEDAHLAEECWIEEIMEW